MIDKEKSHQKQLLSIVNDTMVEGGDKEGMIGLGFDTVIEFMKMCVHFVDILRHGSMDSSKNIC